MNLVSICSPKLFAYLTVNDNNNAQDNANGNNSAQPNTNRPPQDLLGPPKDLLGPPKDLLKPPQDFLRSSSGYISTFETKSCEQGNVKNHESSAIVQNNTCSQGNQINTVVEMTPIGS